MTPTSLSFRTYGNGLPEMLETLRELTLF